MLDAAGRQVTQIENYVSGGTASDQNRTTWTTYSADGMVKTLRDSGGQTRRWTAWVATPGTINTGQPPGIPVAHYDLFSTCHGEIVTGNGGRPEEPNPTTEDPNRDTPLIQVSWRTLKWGGPGVKGKSCKDATYDDILDCLHHRPEPGTYVALLSDCQDDVERSGAGCCLRGFNANL